MEAMEAMESTDQEPARGDPQTGAGRFEGMRSNTWAQSGPIYRYDMYIPSEQSYDIH